MDDDCKIKKYIFIRLSSLGDVILAASAVKDELCDASFVKESEIVWIVEAAYAEALKILLPGIKIVALPLHVLKGFKGLKYFYKIINSHIQNELGETEVVDLHYNLRSRLVRVGFLFCGINWTCLRKERFKRLGYFILKRKWPQKFRPESIYLRSRRLIHRRFHKNTARISSQISIPPNSLPSTLRIGLAPGTQWRGKAWPTELWVRLVGELNISFPETEVTLFGQMRDLEVRRLSEALTSKQIPFFSATDISFERINSSFVNLNFLLSVDSGLAHWAESMGTPTIVLFGPTASDMGFGPRLKASRAIESNLWCRPCSKDGSACFRIRDRYRCMQEITPEAVLAVIKKLKEAKR